MLKTTKTSTLGGTHKEKDLAPPPEFISNSQCAIAVRSVLLERDSSICNHGRGSFCCLASAIDGPMIAGAKTETGIPPRQIMRSLFPLQMQLEISK